MICCPFDEGPVALRGHHFLSEESGRKERPGGGGFRWPPPPGPLPLDDQKEGPVGPSLWILSQAGLLKGLLAPTGHFVARWEGTMGRLSMGNMMISKVRRSRARAGRHVCRPYRGMEGHTVCRSHVQFDGSRGGTEAAPYKIRSFHLELTCSVCRASAQPGRRAPQKEKANLEQYTISTLGFPLRRGRTPAGPDAWRAEHGGLNGIT